uniref:5'-deoxynucleotidase n=1 Tax=candidate division WOR-3 bacterium TaxID=2052148 RepID=A0A7C2PD65_UNCW3
MVDFLDFFENAYRLKRTPRSGFWYYGIKEPETVAEHIFGVSLLAYIFGNYLNRYHDLNLDMEKILKMAIIHELGEALIGDLHLESRQFLGKCVEEAEKKAFKEMSEKLPEGLKDEIYNLYEEFEEGKTPEAIFVRSMDKVDLLIQAFIYEKTGYKNLQNFFGERKNFEYIEKIPEIKEFIESIKARRRE